MTAAGRLDWDRVDVTVPVRQPTPGVRMAGFRYNYGASVDITMIPYPMVTLLFDLSEQVVVHDRLGRSVTGDTIVGLDAGAVRVAGAGAGDVLQIRVSPVVAAAILRDTDVIGGTVTPLRELWGSCATALAERLRATPSWDDRFAVAAAFLRDRAARRFGVAPEIAYAWNQTIRTRGLLRVEDLAMEIGWTRQRLWSRFRTHLGVSPKRACDLVRFDHAAHLLAAGRPPADVAAEAGYADQSHLHRRIKSVIDMTPTGVATAPWLAIDEVAWPTI
ncbi:helix-turn-helix domain-containing protein [Nocardia otitidiscaviarum]|uniref:helix-turn-helix domain-containing protein n=1 Tax=Nocardia otitidiscaviarum TaxID=1823 RepID=UPI002455F7D5|nr:AraC family transcriptional regulator [Nocardia otitidiscaviarum]